MDCSAGFIFLCVLVAQAACGPVRNETKSGALNATFQLMREEIRTALSRLTEPGLLPDVSCLSLNTTELVGAEKQPLASQHLPFFRCYMLKLSKLTPELSPQLQTTSQYTQDVERLTSGRITRRDCSLPPFQQDTDSYVYVKCLLQLLDQWLTKAKF